MDRAMLLSNLDILYSVVPLPSLEKTLQDIKYDVRLYRLWNTLMVMLNNFRMVGGCVSEVLFLVKSHHDYKV